LPLRLFQLRQSGFAQRREGRWTSLRRRVFAFRSFFERAAIRFLCPGVFGELLHFLELDGVPVGRESQFRLDRAQLTFQRLLAGAQLSHDVRRLRPDIDALLLKLELGQYRPDFGIRRFGARLDLLLDPLHLELTPLLRQACHCLFGFDQSRSIGLQLRLGRLH
jgi:hypothetical protein